MAMTFRKSLKRRAELIRKQETVPLTPAEAEEAISLDDWCRRWIGRNYPLPGSVKITWEEMKQWVMAGPTVMDRTGAPAETRDQAVLREYRRLLGEGEGDE